MHTEIFLVHPMPIIVLTLTETKQIYKLNIVPLLTSIFVL